jgi:nucleotide-binding universal stress UspA family protein
VVAAIGDTGALSVIEWAAQLAQAGDTVRIVHAQPAVPFAASDWTLPVNDVELLNSVSARQMTDAINRLRAERHDLVVESAVRTGSPLQSVVPHLNSADLIVVGTPHRCSTRLMVRELASGSRCPVLITGGSLPAERIPHAPIGLLLRDLDADRAVIDEAFRLARAWRSPLVAFVPWQPPDGEDLVAAEIELQKRVDGYLDDWAAVSPQTGVSVEIRWEDLETVVADYGSRPEVLVIGQHCPEGASWIELDREVQLAIDTRHWPTLIVPRAVAAATPPHEPPGPSRQDARATSTRR